MLILSFVNGQISAAKPKYVSKHQEPAPKVITFGHMASGDCEMADGSSITFNPNGTGVFRSVVWTNHTHSGDTWHHAISVKDANGSVLFNLNWDGPNHMNDDGSRYPFERSFNFDPQFFYLIQLASAGGNC
jgi:hypothetical protein